VSRVNRPTVREMTGRTDGLSAGSGAAWSTVGLARYVSLTTYRRDGRAVPTPVWIAADGDALLVTTPSGSGKVKRLRNDSRVQLAPCGRFGQARPSAPVVDGWCEILGPDTDHSDAVDRFRDKYGPEYRAFVAMEGTDRVILRVTPTAP
jgi:PPOX class probable F420-dependent enzyme